MSIAKQLQKHLHPEKDLVLFLDYDGTLDGFVPTPDQIRPNPEVIKILTQLVNHPTIHPIILSGRMLAHLQQLLPIPGLTLAGTYGFEIQNGNGEIFYREDARVIKETIRQLKTIWQEMIPLDLGFYLEDKTWSLAIHGKHAPPEKIIPLFRSAEQAALSILHPDQFHLTSDTDFFEAVPHQANKGSAVPFLINRFHFETMNLLYIGDDAKDEEGMNSVKQAGGWAIKVTKSQESSNADWCVLSPQHVRAFLTELITIL